MTAPSPRKGHGGLFQKRSSEAGAMEKKGEASWPIRERAMSLAVWAGIACISALAPRLASSGVLWRDSYYTIVSGPTWEEAEANAVSLGGHLVTINDAAENDFLFSVGWAFGTSLYMGYSDSGQEGVWVWADGSNSSYTNWRLPLEPSNGEGTGVHLPNGEDYGQLVFGSDWLPGKYWNDISNEYQPDVFFTPSGIAEIPVPVPGPLPLLGVGSALFWCRKLRARIADK